MKEDESNAGRADIGWALTTIRPLITGNRWFWFAAVLGALTIAALYFTHRSWLAPFGLFFDIAGVVLIFFFALPSPEQKEFSDKESVTLRSISNPGQQNDEHRKKHDALRLCGEAGLAFLVFGFLCQIFYYL